MSQTKYGGPWAIALLVAVLGVVVPIGWDMYKSSSRIELQYLRSEVLVSKTADLSKLSIQYDNQDVDQVTRHTFLLINSGKRPVEKNSVVRPITLRFDRSCHILDARIDQQTPGNLGVQSVADASNATVTLTFELLNPSDQATVGILTAGPIAVPVVDARIADVAHVRLVDRRAELQRPRQPIPWTVWPVGIFTLVMLLFTFKMAAEVKRDRQLRKLYLGSGASFPSFETGADYLGFLHSKFSYMLPKERKFAEELLAGLPAGAITPGDREKAELALRQILQVKCASYSAFWMAAIMVIAGASYVFYTLI